MGYPKNGLMDENREDTRGGGVKLALGALALTPSERVKTGSCRIFGAPFLLSIDSERWNESEWLDE